MPTLIHLSFDLMVGIGTLMLLWGLWLAVGWWRHRDLPHGRLGTVFLVGGALSGIAARWRPWRPAGWSPRSPAAVDRLPGAADQPGGHHGRRA